MLQQDCIVLCWTYILPTQVNSSVIVCCLMQWYVALYIFVENILLFMYVCGLCYHCYELKPSHMSLHTCKLVLLRQIIAGTISESYYGLDDIAIGICSKIYVVDLYFFVCTLPFCLIS